MDAQLKANIEELTTLEVKARALLTQFPQGVPPTEQPVMEKMVGRAQELKTQIETQRKTADVARDLDSLHNFLESPATRLQHGINGESSERKMLQEAGWDVKGGMCYAPTSVEGKTYRGFDGEQRVVGKVAMYPEDVLFGEVPADDPDTARYYKTTRAIFAPGYRTAYEHFLKSSVKYRSEHMAFNMLPPVEQKALSEGTDTAGGFIVPPDIQAEMLVRVPQMAVMRQFARVQPTNRDTLRWPAVAPNAGTYDGQSGGSVLSSGFVGSWAGETPAFTDTDASFEAFDIAIKKIRCATKLSNDFVSDAAVNILAFLAQNGAENMALVEDLGFIQGSGAKLEPLGILNVPGILTTNVVGTTSHKISNGVSTPTDSVNAIQDLWYSLPPQYARNARWLMRRSIEGAIRKLVDANGRPVWFPYAESGLAGARPDDLLGAPISQSDWMPADGAANNTPLIVGDFSNYIIGQRTQITSVVLRERFADSDQVGIILFERVGGAAYNFDAFRIGYVS